MNHKANSKLWLMIVMIIATFLSFSFDAMAKPKTAKGLIKEAAVAYDKEDYDTALSLFQEAYGMEPSSSLIYNMGRVSESKGDYNNALAYYRQFVTTPKADEDATTDALNRIEKLEKILTIKDGGSLTQPGTAKVPNINPQIKPSDAPKAPSAAVVAAPSAGCIDLNRSSVSELSNLKGIGEKKAQLIIDSREKDGAYKSIDDLARVKGFGVKTIDKFRDQLCPIGAGAAPSPAAKSIPKNDNAPKAPAAAAAPAGCIDLNRSSVSELSNLKGIGEKKAQLIIDSREKDGAYKSIDDLARVKGFGVKTIDKFRDQLCPIGAGAAPAPAAKPIPKNGNAPKAPAAAAAPAGCIDLNRSSVADLSNLKGIGEKKAQLIIDSREKDGAYKSIDDLARVKGFGAKTIDKFRDQLCPIGAGSNAAAPKSNAKPNNNAAAPAKNKASKNDEPGLVIDI